VHLFVCLSVYVGTCTDKMWVQVLQTLTVAEFAFNYVHKLPLRVEGLWYVLVCCYAYRCSAYVAVLPGVCLFVYVGTCTDNTWVQVLQTLTVVDFAFNSVHKLPLRVEGLWYVLVCCYAYRCSAYVAVLPGVVFREHSMPDVHPVMTFRVLVVAPRKQPAVTGLGDSHYILFCKHVLQFCNNQKNRVLVCFHHYKHNIIMWSLFKCNKHLDVDVSV